jgi:photosystem II stability/assembly factor-like uncharacterized protein
MQKIKYLIKKRPLFWVLVVACLMNGCRKDKLALPEFRELSMPVNEDLSAVWFRDSLNGIATGGTSFKSGFMLSTHDGGTSWQTDTMMLRKMEDVMFDADGQAYVCGQDGAYFLEPGTHHWQTFRTSYRWERACFFPDRKHGVIVGGEGYRLGKIDIGGPDIFWQRDTTFDFPNELASVWCNDSLTMHATGIGWILRSTDGGHSWQRLDWTGDFFTCVQFPSKEVGYICGSSGTLLKTSDGGQTWQKIRDGGARGQRHKAFKALWFSSPDKGWIVGENGLFWYTENGGVDWNPVADVPEDADFTDVYVSGNQGWACAQKGRMFYFQPPK